MTEYTEVPRRAGFFPILLDFCSGLGAEIRASVSGASGAPGTSGWNANACAQKANIQNNPNGSNTLKKRLNFVSNKVAWSKPAVLSPGHSLNNHLEWWKKVEVHNMQGEVDICMKLDITTTVIIIKKYRSCRGGGIHAMNDMMMVIPQIWTQEWPPKINVTIPDNLVISMPPSPLQNLHCIASWPIPTPPPPFEGSLCDCELCASECAGRHSLPTDCWDCSTAYCQCQC